jgi:hypothetical protein
MGVNNVGPEASHKPVQSRHRRGQMKRASMLLIDRYEGDIVRLEQRLIIAMAAGHADRVAARRLRACQINRCMHIAMPEPAMIHQMDNTHTNTASRRLNETYAVNAPASMLPESIKRV